MDQSLNHSFSSISVTDFKNKMISSFDQCELWPINEEKYSEYCAEATKMLENLKVFYTVFQRLLFVYANEHF